MNKCNQCHALFDAPATETIMHYEVDTRREELIPVCPECGGDCFREVELCPACKESWTPLDYCDNCYKDVSDAITELAKRKGMSFEDALKLVDSWFDRI